LSAFCNRGEWGEVGTNDGNVSPSEELADRLKRQKVDGGAAVWGEGAREMGGEVDTLNPQPYTLNPEP